MGGGKELWQWARLTLLPNGGCWRVMGAGLAVGEGFGLMGVVGADCEWVLGRDCGVGPASPAPEWSGEPIRGRAGWGKGWLQADGMVGTH